MSARDAAAAGDGVPGALLPVLLGLAVVVVLAFAVLGWVAERRRREALFAWSVDRAWSFAPGDPRLVDLLPGAPFGRGHSRQVRTVLRGRWGSREALALDYRYKQTSGSGKDRRTRTYDHAVVALHLPVPLPRVHVGPESVFDRVLQAFGADDIEIESHDFNRRYRVEARDRRAAVAILHPRLVELLTSVEPAEWRSDFSSEGPVLVSWWSGALEPAALQHRLVLLDRIVASVPDWLWRESGGEPEAAPDRAPGP